MHFGNQMNTLLWIILCKLILVEAQRPRGACLTGRMLDVQSWVGEHGDLTHHIDSRHSLDLSTMLNPFAVLRELTHETHQATIKYLSLARCQLPRVPSVFTTFLDEQGRNLSQTLEYLTLYGNIFLEVSVPGEQYDVQLMAKGALEKDNLIARRREIRTMWPSGFQRVHFAKLRELDLRSCGIASLDPNIFSGMPQLEALYLGFNAISIVAGDAFAGLRNLQHLDLSNNLAIENDGLPRSLSLDSHDVFTSLPNLRSLDFSNTRLDANMHPAFQGFGKHLERVSLCHSNLFGLEADFFKRTSVRILDISGNHGIFQGNRRVLNGLQNTLQVLYANEIGLNNFDNFENFTRLEILELSGNEINTIRPQVARSLTSLQVLDFRRNRFSAWSTDVFSEMKSLRFLDLRNNMINIISESMFSDIGNVSFIGLTGNPVVCNCHARDLIETAANNEVKAYTRLIEPLDYWNDTENRFIYHSGFADVNTVIKNRNIIPKVCGEGKTCQTIVDPNLKFVLVDYGESAYSCLKLGEGEKVLMRIVEGCREDFLLMLETGRVQVLLLLLIPGILLPLLAVVFVFRRNLRYCYVTMRNSAMLSMVNKQKIATEETNFNYDVFVSYCNEDRPWVLEQLLSHLEMDCSVSLCLHERDFQVGLSILENIVSCMDRSKAIMLVISQQFLLSQWCQFELHLAQHRLLETRREDLILILLEDIPRRLRPNTLHYLMLTKTYIVWPKNKSEQPTFWKRLKKSVLTQKHKPTNVTLT